MKHSTVAELDNWIPSRPVLIGWLALIAVCGWVYHDTLYLMGLAWSQQEDYGHGFFVPLFSGFLLWYRRKMVEPMPSEWTWWATAFLGLALLMRLVSAHWAFQAVDAYSLLPLLVGLTLLVGGWRALRWAWPAIFFLVFMIPLPGFLADQLRNPLQAVATRLSVFVIQTLGFRAVPEGIVIRLESGPLNVAEACSGLRMLMLFFALCVGAVFVLRRPLWQRIVIVVSAIPIAVLSNVVRISATGILQELLGAGVTESVHTWAGLFMMPVGLLILWAEVALMDRLLVEPEAQRPLAIGGSVAGGLYATARQTARKNKE